MANLDQIVNDLSSLTVMEAAELSKLLEEKWGVSAAAPVAAVAGPAAAAEASEEKTEFDVILTAAGDKKLLLTASKRLLNSLFLNHFLFLSPADNFNFILHFSELENLTLLTVEVLTLMIFR